MPLNILSKTKEYLLNKPRVKKALGIILIVTGIFAFITPFTPGSWVFFIGLELLGLNIFFLPIKPNHK